MEFHGAGDSNRRRSGRLRHHLATRSAGARQGPAGLQRPHDGRCGDELVRHAARIDAALRGLCLRGLAPRRARHLRRDGLLGHPAHPGNRHAHGAGRAKIRRARARDPAGHDLDHDRRRRRPGRRFRAHPRDWKSALRRNRHRPGDLRGHSVIAPVRRAARLLFAGAARGPT